MESSPIAQNGIRRRLIAVFAAAAALATSLVATHLTAPPAQANGVSTGITITSETSPDAPGMIKVSWNEPSGVSNLPDWQQWHYRISWVTTSGGAPIGEVVLDQQSMPRMATTSVIIPNLEANTNYTVSVDVVTASASAYSPVAGIASAPTVVSVSAAPLVACQTGLICGEWATSSATSGAPVIRTSLYSYLSSSDMIPEGAQGVRWTPGSQWPTHNSLTSQDWIPATFHFIDYSGQLASHWWSPFASDEGSSFERSTSVLVPRNGPSVNFGTVTLSAGVPISGTLSKEGSGGPTLSAGTPGSSNGGGGLVDADGDLFDDRDGDFIDLCIEVLRGSDASNVEFVSVMCAYRGFGFPDPATPGVEASNPGQWRMALPANDDYFLRFVDRANYFGAANVLLYNVKWATHFWRPDGNRGERLFGASSVAAGLLSVTTVARTGIDGVLRPAKQLRVDVTGIPLDATTSASPTLFGLQGGVYIQDTVSGAWNGGAMTLVTTSASPPIVSSATLSASVTGLVEGRSYRVFIYAQNRPPVGTPALVRSWVVGGGTVEDGEGLVPGDVISESWPIAPIFLTMHRADGSPYGDGEACIAVFPRGSNGSGRPSASACTETVAAYSAPGVVFLQRLEPGLYEIYAYKRSGGQLSGTPLLIDDSFEVSLALATPSIAPGYFIGISDTTRLTGSLGPYDSRSAVVLP